MWFPDKIKGLIEVFLPINFTLTPSIFNKTLWKIIGMYILCLNLILTKIYCIGPSAKIIKKIEKTFSSKNKQLSQYYFLSKWSIYLAATFLVGKTMHTSVVLKS